MLSGRQNLSDLLGIGFWLVKFKWVNRRIFVVLSRLCLIFITLKEKDKVFNSVSLTICLLERGPSWVIKVTMGWIHIVVSSSLKEGVLPPTLKENLSQKVSAAISQSPIFPFLGRLWKRWQLHDSRLVCNWGSFWTHSYCSQNSSCECVAVVARRVFAHRFILCTSYPFLDQEALQTVIHALLTSDWITAMCSL